jgi:histidine triad (HIT) family protein
VVIIPKEHIGSLDDFSNEHKNLIGHIFLSIKDIAKALDLKAGYRVVSNCGELGGQTVGHIHFHLLGGRQLQWPPG